MKRFLLFAVSLLVVVQTLFSRPARWEKLSPMLRSLVRQETAAPLKAASAHRAAREVCAFIRVTEQPDLVFSAYGCRELTRIGNISIVNIPLSSLGSLSLDRRVQRIEAGPSGRMLTDSMAFHLNALPAYAGHDLPQAYTGRGVVMGLMDVGFDLTHPNFYDSTATHYRIRRFWDMLSQDTIGSPLYVGRDYATTEELLALGHSRDGLDLTHGTHTLGIAAGSGYQSPYRGMAPESDICIVANAVTDDIIYIDSADIYKYTYATDALGFKYIFDYAERMGQPCVVSFSEGSSQDFRGEDLLYYEVLDSLVGPGRILVAAAGNRGQQKFWFRKPAGQRSAGTFLYGNGGVDATLKADVPFSIRLVAYHEHNDTLLLNTRDILSRPDAVWTDTFMLHHVPVALTVEAYPSCYDAQETCFDVTMSRLEPGTLGSASSFFVSLEMVGTEADVECWQLSSSFVENALNPALNGGDGTHSVMLPGTAPSVICVGSTFYRTGIVNAQGQWQAYEQAERGRRVLHSSMGPTMDGRTKPDVMAPGANIISSYSSFFLQHHPDTPDDQWSVAHFDFSGRTYAWTASSGTSSATPAVGGAIALWLEACPTLSPEDVMGVIARTSTHPDPALAYPNNSYGYGQIDVYHGLLDILGVTAIEAVSTNHTPARIAVQGSRVLVSLATPSHHELSLYLYSLAGRRVFACRLPAGRTTYDVALPNLSSGVYAIQIDGEPHVTGSTLVRL